ncbi:hypothetical protein Pan216_24520 [Planctomycetes bacterium Pan216]|uniref:Uncharacterized protein n=1 Tax=Kolteria novifilia TaxID=2527975 RepID=A0A518B3M6_9BACT|nr:hypothetical protein Pan216_24520 [Planctomycetes bacterium Pan216]
MWAICGDLAGLWFILVWLIHLFDQTPQKSGKTLSGFP